MNKIRLRRWKSYVDLANFLALVSLKSEARESILSYAWWVLEPLSQLLLFYVAFGVLMLRGDHSDQYLPSLFCGLVAWRWFSNGVMIGSKALTQNAQFLRSFRLPTIVFVLSRFQESIIRIFPILTMLIVYCLWVTPTAASSLLWLVPVILTLMVSILAVTTMTSWISVYVPDIVNIIDIGLRAGLFLSGVFYSIKDLSPAHQEIMLLNPMAVIIESFRLVLIDGTPPHVYRLATIFATCVVIALINYRQHRKLAGKLASMLN